MWRGGVRNGVTEVGGGNSKVMQHGKVKHAGDMP